MDVDQNKNIEEIIVKYIVDYYKENQFYPNYDEIAESVGRSKATIHSHMKKLEREGVIVRKTDFSSQYRLLNMDFIVKSGGAVDK